MSTKARIPYTGATPGGDSNTYTLYDSTATASQHDKINHHMYRLRLKNSASGTLKGYFSDDRGANWNQFYEQKVVAASSTGTNSYRIIIEQYRYVKFDWVNGGASQSTWKVSQSCSDAAFGPGNQTEAAAKYKGPLSGTNTFNFAIGTTHAEYVVHTDWVGQRVSIKNWPNASAPTATIWILFGTSSGVTASRTATVSGSPPAWTGDATIAWPISAGETIDRYIDPTWTHFSIVADENTNKPTVVIFPSDYAVGEG